MAGYIIKNGTIYVPETGKFEKKDLYINCLLYTADAADELTDG